MRLPFVVGLLAGLACAALALVVLLAGLQPQTIVPAASSSPSSGGSASPTSPGGASASGSASAGASAPAWGASSTSASASGSPEASATEPPVGVQVGDRAPALKVGALGGGTIDLTASRGKPVWVSFTASWCPSCRDDLGLMNSFRAQLGERMAMIVVDVKEDPDTVASLVAATNIQAPVGLDQDGTVSAAWQVNVLPVHYWVDGQGIIRSVLYGAAPPDAFIRGIRSVVPGASLTP